MAKSTTKKRPSSAAAKSARSLLQFARDQRKHGCPVCSLPPDLFAEVKLARTKHISRGVVIEWLESEHGISLTAAQFDAHNSGRHDYAE